MIRNIRQTGTILAMDIHTSETGYSSNVKDMLYSHFIENGVILRPLGNVIYIIPPYCIKDSELKKVYKSILSALEKVE
jgi:adenosylmethionine-8-amino-7-oxononanoate aminotransferase